MEKLKNREVWGYACGNLAQNMIYLVVSVYLLYFYTDVFGISAAAASLLFLSMRIFDGINDPLMGFIADKTHTRWGKFRPYILFGSIPLAIITILLFTTPDFGPRGKLVYACITYLFYGVIFTIVLIPYFAMPATMTQDPDERSKISTVNIILSTLAALIVSAAVTPLVNLFPTERTGFPVVVSGCALIAVAAFYICFRSTKERVVRKNEKQYRFRDAFRILWKNTPLLLVSLGYIFYSIQYTIRMASVTYYAKYYMNNEGMTVVVLVLAVFGALAGTGVALPMMKKWGKKTLYIIGVAIGFITCTIMYFIPAQNTVMLLVLITASQAGMSIPLVATWSMAPDTVDYCEYKTGIRAEGTTFGAFSFVQKFASAIAGSLSGAILAVTGYVPNAAQTEKAIFGINCMMTLIPAVCCILCIGCIAFYKLNAKQMEMIIASLLQKNHEKAGTIYE